MSIRVIKEGKLQKFIKTCSDCDCEFEYDESDLRTDYSLCLTTYPGQYETYVVCPCCGKHIHHGTKFVEDLPYKPLKVWYTDTNTLENNLYNCETCPNRPDPNNPVVGDTPCTWCKKNVPYCITDTNINIDPTLYKEVNSLNGADFNLEVDNFITSTYTTDIK